jgi:hypothetical protein
VSAGIFQLTLTGRGVAPVDWEEECRQPATGLLFRHSCAAFCRQLAARHGIFRTQHIQQLGIPLPNAGRQFLLGIGREELSSGEEYLHTLLNEDGLPGEFLLQTQLSLLHVGRVHEHIDQLLLDISFRCSHFFNAFNTRIWAGAGERAQRLQQFLQFYIP